MCGASAICFQNVDRFTSAENNKPREGENAWNLQSHTMSPIKLIHHAQEGFRPEQ